MESKLKWLLVLFAVVSFCSTLLAVIDTDRIVDKLWLSPLCSMSSDEEVKETLPPLPQLISEDGTPPPSYEPMTTTRRQQCKNRVKGSTGAICSIASALTAVYIVYRIFFYKGVGGGGKGRAG